MTYFLKGLPETNGIRLSQNARVCVFPGLARYREVTNPNEEVS
jgi:hypothetical protein